jgi:hypothetical protein
VEGRDARERLAMSVLDPNNLPWVSGAAAGAFLGKVLGEVAKPAANEIGQLLAGPLKRWREERDAEAAAMLVKSAEAVMAVDGTAREVPGRILWPAFDYGSQADDDTLRQKWRALLANAMDANSNVTVRPLYVRILNELTRKKLACWTG